MDFAVNDMDMNSSPEALVSDHAVLEVEPLNLTLQ